MSYGTVLGATFAAMFPERIDRMLIDSVANPLDYMSGLYVRRLPTTNTLLTLLPIAN